MILHDARRASMAFLYAAERSFLSSTESSLYCIITHKQHTVGKNIWILKRARQYLVHSAIEAIILKNESAKTFVVKPLRNRPAIQIWYNDIQKTHVKLKSRGDNFSCGLLTVDLENFVTELVT